MGFSEKKIKLQYICLALLFLLHLIRAFHELIYAQFWAEDALVFFKNAYEHGAVTIFWPYQGYLHSIPRLTAAFSILFPILWAPYIFNIVSFVSIFMPVIILFSYNFNGIITLKLKVVFGLLFVLMPANHEVYMTLTNIQWFLPLGILLILFSQPKSSLRWRFAEYFFLFIASLTGPFSIFVLISYGAGIYFYKYKYSIARLISILIPAIIQLILILRFLTIEQRLSEEKLWFNLFGLIPLKTIYNSIFGIYGQQFIFLTTSYQSLIYTLIGIALILLTIYFILKKNNAFMNVLFLFSVLILASGFFKVLNQLGYNPVTGNRYAFNFIIFLVFSFCFLVVKGNGTSRYFGSVLLSCTFLIAVPFDFNNKRMVNLNWPKQLDLQLASEKNIIEIPINPRPNWVLKFQVKKSSRPNVLTPENNIKIVSKTQNLDPDKLLTTKSIIKNHYFSNGTYSKDSLSGFVIYGSFNKSDKDEGFINLELNKDKFIYYQTGPGNNAQFIEVFDLKGNVLFKEKLPISSSKWSLISFPDTDLPQKIRVKISDEGQKWGEWNAIAFKM